MQSVVETAGPLASHIARLFWVFVGVAAVVYSAVAAFLIHALRRRREPGEAPRDPAFALRVIGGSMGLTVLVLIALALGDFFAGRALARPPGDAMRVRVTAHQWWWEIEYLDANPSRRVRTANELHLPVGRPVALELLSDDVIHSFWVPSLNGKKDLLPGYVTKLALIAAHPGQYTGECAEFCGYQHAHMSIDLTALAPDEFDHWRDAQRAAAAEPSDDLQRRGRDVYLSSSCRACHTIQGTMTAGRLGPDLTHLASRPRIAAGALPNDTGHLAAWISDPQSIKPGTKMPATQMTGGDLTALVAYLRNLR